METVRSTFGYQTKEGQEVINNRALDMREKKEVSRVKIDCIRTFI